MSSPTATTSSSAIDLRDLGISYDCFTRTTTRNHYRVTQDIFKTLYEKGYLVEQTTLGAFSPETGRTLPDRYIEGTCPICGFPEARGDQCDNCGNQLDPVDLIDPKSIIDGSTPEFRETTHLFLDLPAFAEQLEQWLTAQEGWRPNVKNFSLGLVHELKPRAMTRDIDWGVPGARRRLPGGDEADLRLVRRRHRLPVGERRVGARTAARPTRGASGGRTPTPATTTSWARTTSSSTR